MNQAALFCYCSAKRLRRHYANSTLAAPEAHLTSRSIIAHPYYEPRHLWFKRHYTMSVEPVQCADHVRVSSIVPLHAQTVGSGMGGRGGTALATLMTTCWRPLCQCGPHWYHLRYESVNRQRLHHYMKSSRNASFIASNNDIGASCSLENT